MTTVVALGMIGLGYSWWRKQPGNRFDYQAQPRSGFHELTARDFEMSVKYPLQTGVAVR